MTAALESSQGKAGYTLIDLVAGASVHLGFDCCGTPHWMRDGRLAYY